jgi:hypothetical protein
MASLDDILTTQKNGVVAINLLNQTTLREIGNITSSSVTTTFLVLSGAGRLVNFSVSVIGSTTGFIHNVADVALISNANRLCAVTNVLGIFPAGLNFTQGLVIVPGAGQYLNVTYSTV